MATDQKKAPKVSRLDRYIRFRNRWPADELFELPLVGLKLLKYKDDQGPFFDDKWKADAAAKLAALEVADFEKQIGKLGKAKERGYSPRPKPNSDDEPQNENGTVHDHPFYESFNEAQWTDHFRRRKSLKKGADKETRRLWGICRKMLGLQAAARIRSEFKDDPTFQLLLDIEGVEWE